MTAQTSFDLRLARRVPLLSVPRATRSVLRRDPVGAVAILILVLVGAAALLAPVLPLNDPRAISRDSLNGPTSEHWFGTDHLGRDIFSRSVWGARVSLYVALVSASLSTVVAMALGVAGGYFGGLIDFMVQRVVDFFMAVPWIVLVLAIVLALGQGSVLNIGLTLGTLYGVRNSRVVRASVRGVRSEDYVFAAHSIGASTSRIMLRHIIPNVLGPIIVLTSTVWGTAIIAEASLSFLGLGSPATTPSWGRMIADSRQWMEQQPWYVIGPALMLGCSVWAFNVTGDFVRDLVDPRLRQ